MMTTSKQMLNSEYSTNMSVVGGSYSGQANNLTTIGTHKNSPLINHKPSFKGNLRAPPYYKKSGVNYNSDELDSYESSYYPRMTQ
jgi:hypothetical protein